MRIAFGAALAQALVLGAVPVSAQTGPETVTLTMEVNQPSLFDTSRRDRFHTVIDDRSGTTTIDVECSAGTSALFGLSRTDEACAVSGSGRRTGWRSCCRW